MKQIDEVARRMSLKLKVKSPEDLVRSVKSSGTPKAVTKYIFPTIDNHCKCNNCQLTVSIVDEDG